MGLGRTLGGVTVALALQQAAPATSASAACTGPDPVAKAPALPAPPPPPADDAPEAARPEPAGPIVVTASRTALPATSLPLTVTVLGGEDLQEQMALSGSMIDAVSARLPAFSPTREKLTGAGESLRGRSPLFAINGVPQSTPVRDGSRDAYTIDPFFIDRVEIIYGSNALQGIGATGGVVNQVTVGAPATDGVLVRTLLQGSAQDALRSEALSSKAGALLAWRGGRWDAALGGAVEHRGVYLDARGRRIGIDGTQGETQDSHSGSLFARIGYRLSASARLELVADRFDLTGEGDYIAVAGDRATGLPTSSIRGIPPGKAAANRAEMASLSFNDSAFHGGTLTAQLFLNSSREIFGGGVFAMFQDARIDPTGLLFDQSVNRSRKLGGKLSYERAVPGLEALVLTLGADALSDRTGQYLLATGRAWVPPTTFRSVAPFAEGNLKLLGSRVRLVGGLRYENVRLEVPDFTTLAFYGARSVEGGTPSFRRVLKNAGLVVEPLPGLRAYADYSEGYTIPDVGRILRAVTMPNIRIATFLDLRPIVSNNRELGLEWKRGPIDASASYFRSSSKLGSVLVRNSDGVFDVVREGVSIEGFQMSARWRTPLPGLGLEAAYAHVEGGTDTDHDGRIDTDLDGANISPNRLNLRADWDRGPFALHVALRRYFPRTFKGQDPRNDFSGYTLLDGDIAYRFGRRLLSLGVQNLANRQYVTYFSDTQGPTDDLHYFAGRGRTFTLRLSADW